MADRRFFATAVANVGMDELKEWVRRHGVNAKLKRAIMKAYEWNREDWYKWWPYFSRTLERAVREVKDER